MARLLILLACLLSFPAMAEEFIWKINHSAGNFQGPDPSVVCKNLLSARTQSDPNWNYAYRGLEPMGPTQFRCLHTQTLKSGASPIDTDSGVVTRSGTQCPADTEYNTETGTCDSDNRCATLAGTSRRFSLSGVAPDSFMFISSDGKYSQPRAEGCFQGCQAETISPDCRTLTTGAYACRGSATFTGAECTSSSDEPDIDLENAPAQDLPPPTTTESSTPCNYVTGPGGEKTCSSTSTTDKEGQSCGMFNGQQICETKQPSKDDTTIDTTVTTTSTPDGGTKTTKTDTATTTTCVGTKCTTTSTTNTTTTTTKPDGTPGGTTSTCVGEKCKGNSEEGGNEGACITDCGSGEESGEDLEGAEFGEVDGYGENLEAYMQRISDAPLFQAVSGIGNIGSGSCSFSSADTDIGSINLDIMCQMAEGVLSPLYYAFLALFGFAAVRVLLSA